MYGVVRDSWRSVVSTGVQIAGFVDISMQDSRLQCKSWHSLRFICDAESVEVPTSAVIMIHAAICTRLCESSSKKEQLVVSGEFPTRSG